ncbi:cyclic nucleotide-binding/CBS domain-containing protein [Ferruginivarius sediminum]|uniref:CBS domain-containing protein n=1 Tax=Ferruginivarius sediminum TaxID=2661937 RepID=A0A369T9L3_9PROT|nr:CBS domain-containing protein [Ferruginivarius sediminum]RDD62021.1 CBS domain-containing protein [Ferruginivarius sediminum]
MQQRHLREIIAGGKLVSVDGNTTVVEAARVMTQSRIGALVVMHGNNIEGIFSERDVVNRVVARGLDPKSTSVYDVMTTPVITAGPETKAIDALRTMQESGFRHLPVCDDGHPLGVVSLRDFLGAEMAEVQDEISFEHAIEEELW